VASIVSRRRIEWIDTDAAGIYHWTTALRLAEAAEAELHTALGIADRTFGSTPRVHVECDYIAPLRFNDLVDVRLDVADVGRTSVTYDVELTLDGAVVARGRIVACHLDRETGRATQWPEDIRALMAGERQIGP